ncbi:MAG: hypothetical protein WBA63_11925 [Thermomicrobiales bacterium]
MSEQRQDHDHVFEVAKTREAEGLNVYLKSSLGGWTFRIVPVRDPSQPRFWCLRVEPCAQASAIAPTSSIAPYYTGAGMSRDVLMQTLESIKTETSAWLGEAHQWSFRRWLLAVSAKPLPVEFEPRVASSAKRSPESPTKVRPTIATPVKAAHEGERSPAS